MGSWKPVGGKSKTTGQRRKGSSGGKKGEREREISHLRSAKSTVETQEQVNEMHMLQ